MSLTQRDAFFVSDPGLGVDPGLGRAEESREAQLEGVRERRRLGGREGEGQEGGCEKVRRTMRRS